MINRTTRDSDLVRDAIVGGSRSLFELLMVVVGKASSFDAPLSTLGAVTTMTLEEIRR